MGSEEVAQQLRPQLPLLGRQAVPVRHDDVTNDKYGLELREAVGGRLQHGLGSIQRRGVLSK